ncbi:MAG: hypothetical protein ACREXU_11080 [Gammaproteobacteria bacterium]
MAYAPHAIAAVALVPGWMRTEPSWLHAFKADEGDWRRVEALRHAESTPYVGRAVVAPARDGRVMRESGRRSGCRPPRTARFGYFLRLSNDRIQPLDPSARK